MKKILLYIFAIPIGILASFILPLIFETIFDWFLPFDFINNFLDNYVLKILTGWIAVGVTMLVVPSKKLLFGIITLILNILAAFYMYSLGEPFNYFFIIGGILACIIFRNGFEDKEELN